MTRLIPLHPYPSIILRLRSHLTPPRLRCRPILRLISPPIQRVPHVSSLKSTNSLSSITATSTVSTTITPIPTMRRSTLAVPLTLCWGRCSGPSWSCILMKELWRIDGDTVYFGEGVTTEFCFAGELRGGEVASSCALVWLHWRLSS
jgi:hypothetical protein